MDGLFIAVEGIDGAGKDTLGEMLRDFFRGMPREVALTWEPSKGETGQLVRHILNKETPAPATNFEFQRLFVEDRREHIEGVVRPKLEAGALVISVRYWLSTLAYGMLEGPVERYLDLHEEVIGERMIIPDLTLLLDLEPWFGLERVRAAGRHFDHFAKLELLMKIRANYLELARRQQELGLGEIAVINARQPKGEVSDQSLRAIVRKLMEQKEE